MSASSPIPVFWTTELQFEHRRAAAADGGLILVIALPIPTVVFRILWHHFPVPALGFAYALTLCLCLLGLPPYIIIGRKGIALDLCFVRLFCGRLIAYLI
jgi:hypothetical protein